MHKYPLLYKSVVYKHTKHKLTNMAKTHAHKIVCTHTHTHTHTHTEDCMHTMPTEKHRHMHVCTCTQIWLRRTWDMHVCVCSSFRLFKNRSFGGFVFLSFDGTETHIKINIMGFLLHQTFFLFFFLGILVFPGIFGTGSLPFWRSDTHPPMPPTPRAQLSFCLSVSACPSLSLSLSLSLWVCLLSLSLFFAIWFFMSYK